MHLKSKALSDARGRGARVALEEKCSRQNCRPELVAGRRTRDCHEYVPVPTARARGSDFRSSTGTRMQQVRVKVGKVHAQSACHLTPAHLMLAA